MLKYLWQSGQSSGNQTEAGIQTEAALRPIFRFSGRRSFRSSDRCSLWHSGQFSGVQTEAGIQTKAALRPIFRFSGRRSFRSSDRCSLWRSGQFSGDPDQNGVQTKVVSRPKWCPGQLLGVQANLSVFRLISIFSCSGVQYSD